MAKTKKPGKTEQVVALLRKRPHTVPEIAKRVGISVAHTRSILFALDGVKAERSPTRYSLKSTGAMNVPPEVIEEIVDALDDEAEALVQALMREVK